MGVQVNEYERAFEGWLVENGVQYVMIDQARRSLLARNRIKSFDFLLYPAGRGRESTGPAVIVAEVKGRKFKGKSVGGLTSLQCWVGMEDIRGLLRWQEQFDEPGERAVAVIVFAYRFELPSVETDGREVYDFADHRYMFQAVAVADYSVNMKVRSPRWQTVMLSADDFRRLAVPVRRLLTNSEQGSFKRCLTPVM